MWTTKLNIFMLGDTTTLSSVLPCASSCAPSSIPTPRFWTCLVPQPHVPAHASQKKKRVNKTSPPGLHLVACLWCSLLRVFLVYTPSREKRKLFLLLPRGGGITGYRPLSFSSVPWTVSAAFANWAEQSRELVC